MVPKNPHAQFGVCCSLERKGKVECYQGYLETITGYTTIPDSYVRVASILAREEEFDTGLDLLDKYESDPAHSPSLSILVNKLVLADHLQYKDRFSTCKTRFREIVAQAEKNRQKEIIEDPAIIYNLGILAYKEKDYLHALEEFQKLYLPTKQENFSLLAGLNMAAIYEETKQKNEALDVYEEIYGAYSEELNLSDIKTKIMDLRAEVGHDANAPLQSNSRPQNIRIGDLTELSREKLFLKSAFEDKEGRDVTLQSPDGFSPRGKSCPDQMGRASHRDKALPSLIEDILMDLGLLEVLECPKTPTLTGGNLHLTKSKRLMRTRWERYLATNWQTTMAIGPQASC